MKRDEKKITSANMTNIAGLKKELMIMRIKFFSGEVISIKDLKNKRKEVARLFTKINATVV